MFNNQRENGVTKYQCVQMRVEREIEIRRNWFFKIAVKLRIRSQKSTVL